MRAVYAPEPLPGPAEGPVLFLAGPTPRRAAVASWRPLALAALERLGFAGAALLPEDRSGTFRADYTDQVDWEWAGLERADAIAFWIPRHLADLPGFTTNVEFGLWARSGKVALGAPPGAPKLRYLEHVADRLGIPRADTLEGTLAAALGLLRAPGRRL